MSLNSVLKEIKDDTENVLKKLVSVLDEIKGGLGEAAARDLHNLLTSAHATANTLHSQVPPVSIEPGDDVPAVPPAQTEKPM